jgi:hypothetical protein
MPLKRKILVNMKRTIEETRLEAGVPRAFIWALNRLTS